MADDRYEWQKLAARLRQRIAGGEWAVGARMPTVRQLVESEGLSDNTVSKALLALSDEGLIQTKVGHGTTVVAAPEPRPRTDSEEIADLRVRVAELERWRAETQRDG